MIVIPFRESAACCLMCLFAPFYGLYYTITRWDAMRARVRADWRLMAASWLSTYQITPLNPVDVQTFADQITWAKVTRQCAGHRSRWMHLPRRTTSKARPTRLDGCSPVESAGREIPDQPVSAMVPVRYSRRGRPRERIPGPPGSGDGKSTISTQYWRVATERHVEEVS